MIVEHVKRGSWPLPAPTNDQRLQEFRHKMAERAAVTPNVYFHNRLNGHAQRQQPTQPDA